MSDAPPRPERSPRAQQIIVAARHLLEGEGPEALTMRRLGDKVGIRSPSHYKHFANKRSVEAALIDDAFADMGAALHHAVSHLARSSPISALLRAYRSTALGSPNLYRLTTGPNLRRKALTAGIEAWAGEPFFLVTGDASVAQALWSCAHGLTILEIEQRFPGGSDLDRTWRSAAQAFTEEAKR